MTVVQAIPKGDRAELAVEVLTEIGVDRIVPWAAARCVGVWRGDRATKSLAKWRATAREAAKQSRQAWLPEVTERCRRPRSSTCSARSTSPWCCTRRPRRRWPASTSTASRRVAVVVGPEGGITDDELAAFAGAHVVRMGEPVLRTSTAGVAAVAALLSRTSRWG